jgi:hypothetical protein
LLQKLYLTTIYPPPMKIRTPWKSPSRARHPAPIHIRPDLRRSGASPSGRRVTESSRGRGRASWGRGERSMRSVGSGALAVALVANGDDQGGWWRSATATAEGARWERWTGWGQWRYHPLLIDCCFLIGYISIPSSLIFRTCKAAWINDSNTDHRRWRRHGMMAYMWQLTIGLSSTNVAPLHSSTWLMPVPPPFGRRHVAHGRQGQRRLLSTTLSAGSAHMLSSTR